ncbi:hypothetical protein GF356_04135 [candidate division GN15 bacterium]|nr:hypothetical protein [candidate division GN15 bacterium]
MMCIREMILTVIIGSLVWVAVPGGASAQGLVVDHNSGDEFAGIPDTVISYTGTAFDIYYVHTSHGSQVMTGIAELQAENPLYDPPDFHDVGDYLGHNGDTSWAPAPCP